MAQDHPQLITALKSDQQNEAKPLHKELRAGVVVMPNDEQHIKKGIFVNNNDNTYYLEQCIHGLA